MYLFSSGRKLIFILSSVETDTETVSVYIILRTYISSEIITDRHFSIHSAPQKINLAISAVFRCLLITKTSSCVQSSYTLKEFDVLINKRELQ